MRLYALNFTIMYLSCVCVCVHDLCVSICVCVSSRGWRARVLEQLADINVRVFHVRMDVHIDATVLTLLVQSSDVTLRQTQVPVHTDTQHDVLQQSLQHAAVALQLKPFHLNINIPTALSVIGFNSLKAAVYVFICYRLGE